MNRRAPHFRAHEFYLAHRPLSVLHMRHLFKRQTDLAWSRLTHGGPARVWGKGTEKILAAQGGHSQKVEERLVLQPSPPSPLLLRSPARPSSRGDAWNKVLGWGWVQG